MSKVTFKIADLMYEEKHPFRTIFEGSYDECLELYREYDLESAGYLILEETIS